MQNRIIIYATDVDPRLEDINIAKLAVMAAAKELGVKCDCRLSQSWLVWIDSSDKPTFIKLAKEILNA